MSLANQLISTGSKDRLEKEDLLPLRDEGQSPLPALYKAVQLMVTDTLPQQTNVPTTAISLKTTGVSWLPSRQLGA